MKLTYIFFAALILSLLGACSPTTVSTPVPATKTPKLKIFENTVVSLTFDDGDADNYQTRPILKENNLRATFYIISGFTGTSGYMTANQLRGLYEDGNEIGGHTVNHTKLSEVRGAELKREVCQNRIDLLAYGFDVRSFAYPFGYYDEEAKQAVIECGYNNARVVTGGPALIPPADAYLIPAMPYIVQDTRLPKMIRYVTQVEEAGGGWVIFTFHHVCDECDQFAVSPQIFTEFAQWLGEQQKNGLVIKTVGEVIGGEVSPGVAP